MAKFDIPIKRLVQRRSEDWVKFLVPDYSKAHIISFKTEQTPVATSRLDEAFDIDDSTGSYILHFEPQAYHQASFPIRMLRYRADLWEAMVNSGAKLKSIRQVAIFFFKEHENVSHRLTDYWGNDPMIDYTYKVVRIWEQDRREVIERKLIGLYPLLPFMRGEKEETYRLGLEQAVQAIQTVSDHALQMDLYAVFGIVASGHYDNDIIRTYVRREMLMESQIYNEWVEEDRREAREKGREEGMEKGKEQEKIEFAKKMLEKGKTLDEIIEFTGLSKERIEKLREQ